MSRDELNGVSKGKKEEEAEMNARRLGCGDSVDIHIKTRGSEKTEDTGTKGREQGLRFCLRRRAGAEGDGDHPLLLTAPISVGAGTFCHKAKFPTLGKGEPGGESGRPAVPRQSPVRCKEQTRTFPLQILVDLLALVSQSLDA